MTRAAQNKVLWGFFLIVGVLLSVWFAKLFVDAKQAKEVVAIASNSANGSPTPTPSPKTDEDFANVEMNNWLEARFSPANADGYRCTYTRNEDGESFIFLLKNPKASVYGSQTSEADRLNFGITWRGTANVYSGVNMYFFHIIKEDEAGQKTIYKDKTLFQNAFPDYLKGVVIKKNGQFEISGFDPFSFSIPGVIGLKKTGDPKDFKPVPCDQAEALIGTKPPPLKTNTNSNTAANVSNIANSSSAPNYPVTEPAANVPATNVRPMTPANANAAKPRGRIGNASAGTERYSSAYLYPNGNPWDTNDFRDASASPVVVSRGTRLRITTIRYGEWYKVTTENGQIGWINGYRITPDK